MWIACKDKMPPDFTNVIVFQTGYNPPEAGICESYYNPDQEYPFVDADEPVTHWMPFPPPPSQEK